MRIGDGSRFTSRRTSDESGPLRVPGIEHYPLIHLPATLLAGRARLNSKSAGDALYRVTGAHRLFQEGDRYRKRLPDLRLPDRLSGDWILDPHYSSARLKGGTASAAPVCSGYFSAHSFQKSTIGTITPGLSFCKGYDGLTTIGCSCGMP